LDIFTGIIVFVLIWWTALFTVLPFGIKRDATGKPDDPRMAHKFLATTMLSAFLWVCIHLLIEYQVVSFYDMASIMIEKDKQE
jgi:predicted secreted protein